DFAGKKLETIPADQILRGVVSIASEADAAELFDQHVVKNPVTGAWRLTFEVKPKRKEPLELRAYLDKGGDTLTETWSYVILPYPEHEENGQSETTKLAGCSLPRVISAWERGG